MVSQSQEYTTQATFFELRAKSQPKKHDGIARAIQSCFLNKAKMRHNPRRRRGKSAKTSRRAVFSKSGRNSTEGEKQATRHKKQQKPPRKVNPLGIVVLYFGRCLLLSRVVFLALLLFSRSTCCFCFLVVFCLFLVLLFCFSAFLLRFFCSSAYLLFHCSFCLLTVFASLFLLVLASSFASPLLCFSAALLFGFLLLYCYASLLCSFSACPLHFSISVLILQ